MAAPTRRATEARYARLRNIALQKAEEILVPTVAPVSISLRLVTPDAIHAFSSTWEQHPDRRTEWPWAQMHRDYRRNEPDRFEVAIWSDVTLCGLAIGKLKTDYCCGDFVEGSPLAQHPLKEKVIPSVLTALEVYAILLEKREIRLIRPAPELIPRYEKQHFTLVSPKGQKQYCVKVVS
ncbi:MAG TPA: hypothetical protein VMF62_12310 [Acetobacteraceae bacterium]|nr:hypothetical protein [Acetobacteraceae bacterium]